MDGGFSCFVIREGKEYCLLSSVLFLCNLIEHVTDDNSFKWSDSNICCHKKINGGIFDLGWGIAV